MLQLILLAYLSFRNSVRAKSKGLNAVLWGGLSVLSYFIALFIGCLFVIFNFCADKVNLELLSSSDEKIRLATSQQLIELLQNSPLESFTIELFGIGGYLFVRYLLDRKPEKKEPEIHWMDKLGQNRDF